jgi:type I restriction enzyme M protein
MTINTNNSGTREVIFHHKKTSKILAEITVVGKTEISRIYDFPDGSGSLLLMFTKMLG